MNPSEIAEVEVRGLAAGGAGVADLPDGRVVFVPRTAPGDRARIRVVKSKKRWALGELCELTTPSAERAEPACRLYTECGGCTLQHLPYDVQLAWKGRFISDALRRIGNFDATPPVVSPSEAELRYRNRVTYTLRRLHNGRVVAGFHALGRPAHVLEVRHECRLPEEAIGSAWTALRAGWGPGARSLPSGGRLSLTLRSTDDGVILVVEGGEPGWDAGPLAEAVPVLHSVWHRPGRDGPAVLVAGEPATDSLAGEQFPAEGRAFLQVNRSVGARLVEHVMRLAGSGDAAVDAYCGVGLYGRALARQGWRVTGIEVDPAACRAAAVDPPKGFEVLTGTVEDRLAEALPAELVVLNPPRAGLHADVPPLLVERRPERLIYVSCDPATLARDAAALAGGYDLEDLAAFDLFPQTAHVETVAVFRSRGEA